MADTKPLSDAETGERLRKAVYELGEAPGATIRADTVLTAARNFLTLVPRTPLGAVSPEDRPLSDVQTVWRLYNALQALGNEPGATPAADLALTTARHGIIIFGGCLIAASEKADSERD